ncbi:hypothetical protein DN41_3017 [Vibrio cholerae]|nr:hypothetical protein DN41_3017 [Vibrio cholerae]
MDIEHTNVSNSNLNLDIKDNFINVQFSTCALSEVNQIRYNYLQSNLVATLRHVFQYGY